MKIRRRDQKIFWKLLGKLKHSKNDLFKNNISGGRWNNHFKDILKDSTREIKYPPNSSETWSLGWRNNYRGIIQILLCSKAQQIQWVGSDI